ncbi:MAG: Gfo/Idh/MocA family oxidoreductase [Thermoguttaceae bacterium]
MQRRILSRREMLKRAGAALGALSLPTIVPHSVFGQNAPSNRVSLAAIGVGGRGTDDCGGSFLPLENVRFVAAVDCRKSRREGFTKMVNDHYRANVCTAYRDFRDVLARKDVDGVVISTPDHWHVPLAVYAAQAGKDMYVEKPLGVAMAWAWKLREEVARNKVVFQYGTQQRGDQRQFRRACELVRNGYLGEVRRVDVWAPDMSSQFDAASVPPYGSTRPIDVPADLDYEMWIGPAPMKPYTADRATNFGAYHIYDYALGFIAGWGAHPLDIAQWGLGTDETGPIRYQGTGKIPPKGSLWDSIESWDVQCEYANGVKMHFMGHRVAEPIVKAYHPAWCDHGTTFFGTKGWINVNRTALYASDKALQKAQVKPEETHLTEAVSQARDFVDCIKSRKLAVSPLEAAIRSDTISHLSDVAIRLGRAIAWDPQKEQIVNDAEASKMLNRTLREPWKLD